MFAAPALTNSLEVSLGSVMAMVEKIRARRDKFQQSCCTKSTKWTPHYKHELQCRAAMRSSEGDDVDDIVVVEIKSACWVRQTNNVSVVFFLFKIST